VGAQEELMSMSIKMIVATVVVGAGVTLGCGGTDQPGGEPSTPVALPHAGLRATAYVSAAKRWINPAIGVCWEEVETPELAQARSWIRMRIQSELARKTRLSFHGWDACPSGYFDGIRISQANLWPSTVGLGTDVRGVRNGMILATRFETITDKDGKPAFDLCTRSERERRKCIEHGALHEFGHAIGLSHEQNRPDTPADCTEPPQGNDGDTLVGDFDAHSVMNYCNVDWSNAGRLSYGDLLGIEHLYGRPNAIDIDPAGFVSIVPHGASALRVRHRLFRAEVSELSAERDEADATFRIVPGLADSSYVSFESVNFPGHFLRHSNFQIVLAPRAFDPLFDEDATFAPQKGMADPAALSFESFNFPGRFMRHEAGQMRLTERDSASFVADATFTFTAPAWRSKAYRFRSVNFPNKYVRHQFWRALLLDVSTPSDYADSRFDVLPATSPFVRLRADGASNGATLRHRNFELWADAPELSPQFASDSAFRIRRGLNDNPRAVSLESRNLPNHFVRHRDFALYLESGTSAAFKADASFYIEVTDGT